MIKYQYQELPGLTNGEVEGKETVQLPDGQMYEFKGKPHSRGGIKAMLIPGSRIFSKHIKLDKETVEAIDGTKRSMSPAELSRKYDPSPYRKILTDTTNRTDDLRRNTAQLMVAKYSAQQDVIFNGQENHKDYHKNKNFKFGGEVKSVEKYQGGGYTGFDIPQVPDRTGILGQNMFGTPQVTAPNSVYNSRGLSVPDYANNRATGYYFPQGGDPFWTEGVYNNRGLQTGRNLQLTNNVQEQLSYPNLMYGDNPEAIRQHNTSYAYDLRSKMTADPDKFLTAEVVDPVTRERIPVARATDAQIEASNGELILYNRRTGKPDLVDGRLGNVGEATQNRSFPVHATTMKFDQTIKPIETLTFKPEMMPAKNIEAVKENPPIGTYDDKVYDETIGTQEVGVNPDDLLYGLQQGLDLANLAMLRRDVPYYQYRPLESVQSRFDPINQLSQDRGFNIAREALEKSNLPEQVKQAQLNQITANNVQGRNQVDLTNYQGNLQNNNSNLQATVGTINANNQNREGANHTYMQELQRSKYMEQAQRQVFIDRMLENYRMRRQNQMNIGLVNQLSNNYNFSTQTGQVGYTPGQGNPNVFNNLDNYRTQ